MVAVQACAALGARVLQVGRYGLTLSNHAVKERLVSALAYQ